MNALVDLTQCREHMTINVGGRDDRIRLSGTIDNPYFSGKDVCTILGYIDPKDALQRYVDKDDKKQLFMVFIDHTLGGQQLTPQSVVLINLCFE